jgi:hypothetical protein
MDWLINLLRRLTDRRYRRALRKREMERALRAQGYGRRDAKAKVAENFEFRREH